jgi:hypothetical protein
MTNQNANLWELLEDAPSYAESVAELYSWSLNYDYQEGTPYLAFLDLIGWSKEHWGQDYCEDGYAIDYASTEMFGKALIEWGNRPQDVLEFIKKLGNADE